MSLRVGYRFGSEAMLPASSCLLVPDLYLTEEP